MIRSYHNLIEAIVKAKINVLMHLLFNGYNDILLVRSWVLIPLKIIIFDTNDFWQSKVYGKCDSTIRQTYQNIWDEKMIMFYFLEYAFLTKHHYFSFRHNDHSLFVYKTPYHIRIFIYHPCIIFTCPAIKYDDQIIQVTLILLFFRSQLTNQLVT